MAHSGGPYKDNAHSDSQIETWEIVGKHEVSESIHVNQQQPVRTDNQDMSGAGRKRSSPEVPASGSHLADNSACKKKAENPQAASDLDSIRHIPLPDHEDSKQDEQCTIIISFIDDNGQIVECEDVKVDLELSVWLHIKNQEGEMENLTRRLKQEDCEILEHSDRIALACRRKSFSTDLPGCMLIVDTVTNLFKELTQKYNRINLDDSNENKIEIVKQWPTTQLYTSGKATAHRTHCGKVCIVTKKEYKDEVLRELQHFRDQNNRQSDEFHRLESDTSKHTLLSKTNDPSQHGSQTREVILTELQLMFLESMKEAQDYVVSCFQEKKITATFVFEEKKLILKTHAGNERLHDEILLECICTKRETLPSVANPRSFEDRHSDIKGKFMFVPDSTWTNVTLVATRDIFPRVQDSLMTLLPVITEKVIGVSIGELEHLITQNQWEDLDYEPFLYVLNHSKCRVSVRPVRNDSKCSLFVRGPQHGIEEFENEVSTCLSKLKVTSSSLTEKHNLLLFLQTRKEGLRYVENVLKEKGFTVIVTEKGVVIYGSDHNTTTYECLSTLILSKEIPKDFCQLLELEELWEIIFEKNEVHKDKLMVNIDKTNCCLTIVGTADIFPAVLQEVEKLRSMYTWTEDQVCISEDNMQYVQGKGLSKLQAMADDPRLKVQVTKLDKELGYRLAGSTVGVTTVKEWLQNTSTVSGRKAISQSLHAVVPIKGHMQKLLRQSSHARQVIKHNCKDEGFEIDFDAGYDSAKVFVKTDVDIARASKMLLAAVKPFTFEFGMDHIHLSPTETKTLLWEREPSLVQDVIMDVNDSRKELTVFGTMDVIESIVKVIKNMLCQYTHAAVLLPLEYEEMKLVRKKVENEFHKVSLQLFWSNEKVEIIGARMHVQDCLVTICKCLTGLKPKIHAPPKLQVCEIVVSELLYMSLEQNKNIQSYLEELFEDCGYAFALHNNRLKLCAGSLTALSKVWDFFLSCICEMKLSLRNEPVVKLFGLRHICNEVTNSHSHQGKVKTSCDENTGLLTIVCTSDIKDLVEENLSLIKKKYVQKVIDLEHQNLSAELLDLRQLEEEMSRRLPDMKDMFKIYEENGKICVIAVRKHMKVVETKMVQILSWKKREIELNRTNPSRDIQLSDFEFEFIQKPEVISYIDEKLQYFSFGLDMVRKSLKIYCIKQNLLEQGVCFVKECLKQDKIELLNDPLLDNCTLSQIKDMLDIQEQIHGCKLLIRINDQLSSLNMICTDDVRDAVISKFEGIKQNCSHVTYFIQLSKERWNQIRVIYPEFIHAIEKEDVRVESVSPSCIQISGHAELALQVKRKLETVIDKVHVSRFPVLDEIGTLQTHEGQKLLSDIQRKHGCVIKFQKHVKKNTAELAVKECLAQKHLRLTHGCVRLSQWTKNGSSISVIQGHIQDVNTGILVVPYVGGKLPEDLSLSLQKEQILRIQNSKGDPLSISNPKWCKCSSSVFFGVPKSLKSGENKEKGTLRETVKDILRKAAKDTNNTLSCVFVLEGLHEITELQAPGLKCIIKGTLEAFKDLKCALDVQLLTDEKNSNDTLKILEKACPGSKKISLLKQVKKLKKKMGVGKGKPTQLSKPNLKIVCGALEKQEADVVVISCHPSLDLSRGVVSKALDAATSGQLQQQCLDKYSDGIRCDELAITNFRAKGAKVYHGVLYPFPTDAKDEQREEKCWKMLYEFVYHCLYEANKQGAASIAFPALGSGKLDYPITGVAEVMFNTVEWFFNIEQALSLKTVNVVLHGKDTENIKVFNAERMARLYHVKSFTEDTSANETRHDCGPIMLQIIGSDLHKCEGTSDGLLCFWDKDQLADPSNHPIVGKCLESIDWAKYEQVLKRNGKIATKGGGLPATRIIHTLVKSDFKATLYNGLKYAADLRCETVQVELSSEDLLNDSKALVTELLAILKSVCATRNILCLLTVVIPTPEHYKSVVSQLRAASSGLLDRLMRFTGFTFGTPENVPAEDDGPHLIVSGTSEDHCQEAHQQVLEAIQQMHARLKDFKAETDRNDSSSVDSLKHFPDSDKLDTDDKVFGMCCVKLNPLITEDNNWSSIRSNLEHFGLELQSHGQHVYAEGSFEALSKAHKQLSKPADKPDASGFETDVQQTGLTSIVSNVHFEAVLYFIGEKEFKHVCDSEEVSDSKKKILFTASQEHKEKVQSLHQRIQGVIQEEVDLSKLDQIQVSKQKAYEVEKSAMSDNRDVYIKYAEDRHVMILFAEDWDKMSRAKKRMMLQFGQGKVASRGKRRFANQSDSTLKTDVKQHGNISFVMESGAAVAEGRSFTVKVFQESIVGLALDVIVNAANGQLSHGGGVARIIARAAGPQLEDEGNSIVLQRGDIPVTDLAVTNSGNLPCKRVFHAVGPRWSDYTDKERCLEDLCCTILRCLCEAVNRSFETIAFPSISSSIFGVPKEECAKMYVRALKSFDTLVERGSVKEVHFVDVTDIMVNIIQTELQNTWGQPGKKENLTKDRAFIMKCLDSNTSASVTTLEVTPGEHKEKDNNAGAHWLGKSGSVSLRVVKDDILKVDADAILSWEETSFSTTRPLHKLMNDAGGESYRRGRDKAYRMNKWWGDIAEGPGGSLPQKHVIFAIIASSANNEDISKCLKKALDSCVKNKLANLILTKPFSKSDHENVGVTFMETTVDQLIKLDQDEKKPTLHVQIVDKQQHVVDGLMHKLQQYLVSCGLAAASITSKETEVQEGADCVICCFPMPHPVKLKCGHQFCKQCVDKSFKIKAVCPVCKMKCGEITGNMPHGTMTDRVEYLKDLPGYKGCGTIVITYAFSGGYQTEEHPDPGQSYRGITRTTYLPNNAEGQKVLSLLKVAWKRRLTFTIGRSVTMGKDSCITWNEIHHKTSRSGGPTDHGYPDPDYLRRVQEELADQGVTEEDLGATGTSV